MALLSVSPLHVLCARHYSVASHSCVGHVLPHSSPRLYVRGLSACPAALACPFSREHLARMGACVSKKSL